MSYVSRDPRLWFNIPGILAAYMPVRAPDSTLARRNVALGGLDAYRAVDGVAPAWNAAGGWAFNGTQWLNTGILPATGYTITGRYANLVQTLDRTLIGAGNAAHDGHEIRPMWNNDALFRMAWTHGSGTIGRTPGNSAVLLLSGRRTYYNGQYEMTIGTTSLTSNSTYGIGAKLYAASASTTFKFAGDIQVIAIYARTLSDAEAFACSHQIAYCDINPEWSAWGRQRRYWYAAAGRVGVWGAHPTIALPGGVSIEPAGALK